FQCDRRIEDFTRRGHRGPMIPSIFAGGKARRPDGLRSEGQARTCGRYRISPERRSLNKRFIAIRTSVAKHTVARKYMKSIIPMSPVWVPWNADWRTKLHSSANIKPEQKTTTGHAIRMFRVTRVPESSSRKLPSIIGRNESR